jgi:cyclomaltodextrinase / maltogenic alpha-amylase / neopullulanase
MKIYVDIKSIFLFAVFFIFQGCSLNQFDTKPPELIDFRTIESGQTDSVSIEKLLFKQKYNIEFFTNENVEVKYDTTSKVLILNPIDNFKGLTFVNFKSDGDDKVLPLIVRKKSEINFSYKPTTKPKNVFVMGNFNNWSRTSDEMLDEDGDGVFTKIIPLEDGVYEYQYVIDKKEIFDPNNKEKVDNGFGSFNSLKRVESKENKNSPNLYFLPSNSNKWLELAIDNQDIDDIKIHVLLDNNIYSKKFVQIKESTVKINLRPLKSFDGMHSIRVVATKNNQPGNVITAWIKDGNIDLASNTFIWNDAIIYSVMPDRFLNANPENDSPIKHPKLSNQANFNGGDLQGIISKMKDGYFDSLGVNTLWIFPLNKTTNEAFQEWPEPHRYYSGYHGYWPVEPREVEPRFGTLEEFKQLVNEAHKRDIKVLLDFISNHTHIDHPYYKNHPEWYGEVNLPNGEKNIRRWDEYRLTTWFDTFLPSFNFLDNPAAINAVTDDALWWLENTGIDGFRHDATKHVPHQFWSDLTRKVKTKVNPSRELDVYQIGETFGSHNLIKSYVNNSMLDAQFNFNQFFIARRVFSENDGIFLDLSSSIEKSLEVYGYNHVMGNLMDSHDQVRMMALFDGDLTLSDNAVERAFQQPRIEVENEDSYNKEIIFFTYMLTIPGVPVIYYGDEFGVTGAGDPDNRRMMRFDNNLSFIEKKQLEKVQDLIHIRKNHSSLRRGDYKTLYVTDNILVYTRGDVKERIIVAINKSDNQEQINFTLPNWIKIKTMKSLLERKEYITNNNKLDLNLNPYSSYILEVVN